MALYLQGEFFEKSSVWKKKWQTKKKMCANLPSMQLGKAHHLSQVIEFWYLGHMGLNARKPVFRGMQTTKA